MDDGISGERIRNFSTITGLRCCVMSGERVGPSVSLRNYVAYRYRSGDGLILIASLITDQLRVDGGAGKTGGSGIWSNLVRFGAAVRCLVWLGSVWSEADLGSCRPAPYLTTRL